MNIFVLDENPDLAAEMLCDQHLGKVGILESAQILSTVLRGLGAGGKIPGLYAPTHVNHPCTIWAGESVKNFFWLLEHASTSGEIWETYKNKKHKSHEVIIAIADYVDWLESNLVALGLPPSPRTPFRQCMPDEFKVPENPVAAYRNLYKYSKSKFAKWAINKKPDWLSA